MKNLKEIAYRKHAFSFTKYQNWYICIVIDGIVFKIHTQLLSANQIGDMNHRFDAMAFQFTSF